MTLKDMLDDRHGIRELMEDDIQKLSCKEFKEKHADKFQSPAITESYYLTVKQEEFVKKYPYTAWQPVRRLHEIGSHTELLPLQIVNILEQVEEIQLVILGSTRITGRRLVRVRLEWRADND